MSRLSHTLSRTLHVYGPYVIEDILCMRCVIGAELSAAVCAVGAADAG
jgi:hypothetical protein